ncbi:hypothetical protein DKX38_016938 [Salix brachista]|uniref:Uncharacterized protein n=1 Tax=Salix brachista TaxID=2182728 RepID=A0A5N5KU29_9ROSI|nr:hypothetical protein DKX38_016938 [Salix brachista]
MTRTQIIICNKIGIQSINKSLTASSLTSSLPAHEAIFQQFIILTVAGALLVVVILGSFIYCLVKRNGIEKWKKQNSRQIDIGHGIGRPSRTDFQLQSFHRDGLDGILSDGKEVAVKRLSPWSEQGIKEFTNEVQIFCPDDEADTEVNNFLYELKRSSMRERNRVCGSYVDGKEPSNRNCELHKHWAVMCAGRSSRQAHNVICGFSFEKSSNGSSSTKTSSIFSRLNDSH